MTLLPMVEIVARSHDLQNAGLTAVICVPTYKRPELLKRTLASLIAQRSGGATEPTFAIVVVDNDGEGREGSRLAADLMSRGLFIGAVLVEPRQGNCKAYNAAWHFVRDSLPDVPFICGIDDDEEASPGWLPALLAGAEMSGAGIVGGPVRPIFSDARFDHLKQHPIYSSHYQIDGPVPQLYSSANYLVRASVLDTMGYPYLDEAFDYKGGGDTDFFTRARKAGVRFHWASQAQMTENMPARRTEFSWINARALRNGMISALIAHKADPSPIGRLACVLKSLALLIASPVRGLVLLARTGSPVIALYHAQVALGRLGAEFGLNIEQYRVPDKN